MKKGRNFLLQHLQPVGGDFDVTRPAKTRFAGLAFFSIGFADRFWSRLSKARGTNAKTDGCLAAFWRSEFGKLACEGRDYPGFVGLTARCALL